MGILDSLKNRCCTKKATTESSSSALSLEDKAEKFIEALGGSGNIEVLDTCITRLRLVLKDRSLVNKTRLNELGSKGNVKVGEFGLQVIIGSKAIPLAEVMRTKL
ncbi:EIICBA-Glc 2 [Phocoenobacter uteri]|uniref:EIICBA-Glc 2 n=1 Tax=Phocoenobacter uteri TaxID=146806 RepID=A0A379C7H6_9PAST|nr:PTS glucose/sucrose transporter subunit IIB [Phocoenobacter uteri]MDG6882022.1 hypothetical protein [Phocoenobacter uteri]SUB58171.1 EIICBA-Glc 2 [Phocoenobacter uteri]